jgi:Family of unknown function (DUF5343)
MAEATPPAVQAKRPKAAKREIPGNFPYTQATGKLADALKNLISAERPQKFNASFLDSVLKITGGSAAPIPPILKKCGMLGSDNSPTDLYSKFKSDSTRPDAALVALRTGFSEIFKRNEYAHKLPDERITDTIVEITGLNKTDPIARAIFGTFNAFNEYAKVASEKVNSEINFEGQKAEKKSNENLSSLDGLNLVNTINVVLPETTNVEVYNAIFKSIRENLIK